MAMQSMQLEQGQSIPGRVRPGVITDLKNAGDHPQLHNQVL